MGGSVSGDDVTGVNDGQPAVAGTRDKNSGIGGATPSPLGFHREKVSMALSADGGRFEKIGDPASRRPW